MKRIVLFLLMAAALLLPARAAYAIPLTFVAHLSGANEIPPANSLGTGLATVVLDAAAHTMQLNVVFSGLTTPDVAAHIHCGLPFPFDPINIGVATTLPAFPGFPLGVTSGTYSSAVLSLTDPATYNPNFVTLEGGIAAAEVALVAGIENSETYLNIHTQQFPGGEIRGFLVAAPEPSAILLLGAGLVGLAFVTWRRHRRSSRGGSRGPGEEKDDERPEAAQISDPQS
jgi:CHRD domain/PEP-CTERM motif